MREKFNRNAKIFLLSDGLSIAGYNVIDVFLAILLTDRIAKGEIQYVGYVISVYTLVRILSEVFISRRSKKLSVSFKVKYISIAYFIYGLLIILMGFSTQLWQIFLFQFILGALDGSTYPLKWSIFSEIIKKSNKDNAWAIEDIVTTISYAIVAAIIGWISQYSLTYAFIAFGILFSFSGIAFWFIKMRRFRNSLF